MLANIKEGTLQILINSNDNTGPLSYLRHSESFKVNFNLINELQPEFI